jgi:glycosyltransferase involved in cell wall biosynthesis
MIENPLVTVVILTYNHEDFIRKSVESALHQKTNFSVEIVVGNDDSTDATRVVLSELEIEYPDRLTVIDQDAQNRIYIEGKPTGRYNFLNVLRSCKGKYISILDGDDYWVDDEKLQRQVDFLEANSDYSACTANTHYLKSDELSGTYIETKEAWLRLKIKDEISYSSIIKRAFPHTSTWIYRNEIEFKDDFLKYPVGDVAIFLLVAAAGKIKYEDKVVSVYRIHDRGVAAHFDRAKRLLFVDQMISMFMSIDAELDHRFRQETAEGISFYLRNYMRTYPTFSLYIGLQNRLIQLKLKEKLPINLLIEFSMMTFNYIFANIRVIKRSLFSKMS